MAVDAEPPEALAARVAAREPAGVARAISIVEDRRAASAAAIAALLRALAAQGGAVRCHRVGITGPPGVGKSSLVSALARAVRDRGRTVGVLAIDPSSPRSGGALLGDRARIQTDPTDDGTFVRSMASGGDLGGLARAAGGAVEVLSAAYDVVIVETTGVGQSETDIEHVADTVAMVIQPGSGDVLQFLKAGILEIPDLFVVNKADLGPLADRAASELTAALGVLDAASASRSSSVIRTSATEGDGIAELLDAIDAHRRTLEREGTLLARRVQSGAKWAARLFQTRYGERGVEQAGGRDALLLEMKRAIEGGAPALEAVARLGADLD